MPLYLCKPGWSKPEPWKLGKQVYAYPFDIHGFSAAASEAEASLTLDQPPRSAAGFATHDSNSHTTHAMNATTTATTTTTSHMSSSSIPPKGGIPIRRVRHSEVVLADQVSVAHGVYWLRLRWPGSRGGVAGYMDIGSVSTVSQENLGRWSTLGQTDGTSGGTAAIGGRMSE